MTARPGHQARRGTDGGTPTRSVPPPVRAVISFETFYERELRSVIGLAYALSGSRVLAEDLAQDAFVAAHKNWDKISRYDKPEAWVRRVVANMSVSAFRRKVREARAIARFGRPEPLIDRLPAEADHFWRQVRGLPKRQAQAVALHYLEDRSVADIAAILECSESTVRVHLHKGRKRLAERMDVEDDA